MFSEVEIYNQAAVICGKNKKVISPDENTTLARACSSSIKFARLDVLRAVDWGFASISKKLTPATTPAPINFTHSVQYPNDAVFIREIVQPRQARGQKAPFQVSVNTEGNKVIYCNMEAPTFRYTLNITEISNFNTSAAAALAQRLAWYIAPSLGIKKEARAAILREYEMMLDQAAEQDANESGEDERAPVDWLEARN